MANNQTFLEKNELSILLGKKFPQPGDIYISNELLNDAVKAALLLKQPLLLTGEPGTGKTTLGRKVARELHEISGGDFYPEPLFFSTKSDSSAMDLFYTYDAITHFQHSHLSIENKDGTSSGAVNYIKLQALGLAILAGHPEQLMPSMSDLHKQIPADAIGKSFVVVIDEVDKAPRDFPNDLLFELESLTFRMKETGNQQFVKSASNHIFIILTSNSEKNLPEPFLRRCVFHFIEHPSAAKLATIIAAYQIRSGNQQITDSYINSCIRIFGAIREKCQDKKPSTAELISWVQYLANEGFEFTRPDIDVIRRSLGIIVKSNYDLQLIDIPSILHTSPTN